LDLPIDPAVLAELGTNVVGVSSDTVVVPEVSPGKQGTKVVQPTKQKSGPVVNPESKPLEPANRILR
jgi:hypothetical protein